MPEEDAHYRGRVINTNAYDPTRLCTWARAKYLGCQADRGYSYAENQIVYMEGIMTQCSNVSWWYADCDSVAGSYNCEDVGLCSSNGDKRVVAGKTFLACGSYYTSPHTSTLNKWTSC